MMSLKIVKKTADVPDFKIELKGEVIKVNNRNISFKQQQKAEVVLKEFIEAGVLQPNKSEITHDFVIVPNLMGTSEDV